ncbi:MAG: ABC transporter ATP-binding protein [Oscillospiraceae bacterium]|nr:ABC transporter ATP-binding protein [Oscillospiraceae bacterium]
MRRLLRYVGEYRKYAIIAMILVAMEVVFDVAIPMVMSNIIDNGINGAAGPDPGYCIRMGAVMLGMSTVAMLCGILSSKVASQAGAGYVRNLRNVMFNKIQQFSFKNIDHFTVPSLITRLTMDMRQMRMAFMTVTRMLVRSPMQLIFSFVMVAKINLRLASVFAIALPILSIGLYAIFKTAHPRFQEMMTRTDDLNATTEENLIGIRVVKTFVRGEFEKHKFSLANNAVRDNMRRAEKIVNLNEPFFSTVMYCCMIGISWFGGKAVIRSELTVGEFMSYLSYIRMVLMSLLMISSSLMQIVFADTSVGRLNAILDEQIDITDTDADPDLMLEDASIRFENVDFKYSEEAEENALTDINIDIKPGQVVGILGPTGAGKTSLISLIPRLYDVTDGKVIVGGHDVRDYKLDNLRKDVAVVLQKNLLFTGTIEENILWGDMNATHEEVVEAAKCAQADDFIMSFPDGYETKIEQSGVNVSGGQQQRLCIARALIKKPKIVIMDDSTSAVDTDTDKRIRMALKEKLAGMTTIIIAQRVASVMEADQILMMENGRIVSHGTHEELLQISEAYRDLYESQTQGVQA